MEILLRKPTSGLSRPLMVSWLSARDGKERKARHDGINWSGQVQSPLNAAVSFIRSLDKQVRGSFQLIQTESSVVYQLENCRVALVIDLDSGKLKNIQASSISNQGFTGYEMSLVIGFLQRVEESLGKS